MDSRSPQSSDVQTPFLRLDAVEWGLRWMASGISTPGSVGSDSANAEKEGIPPCRKGHAFPWGVLTLGSGQLATLRLQRPQAA